MANRLTRDEILIEALDLVDSPRLDEKDRPAGASTIDSTALSIRWLQRGLDLAHNLYPWQGELKTATFTLVAGTGSYSIATIASDFVLDFKNGIVLPDDKGRLRRTALNLLLDFKTSTSSQSQPQRYSIHNNLFVVRPIPRESFASTVLYYYSLPSVLTGSVVPHFPSDMLLVEFVHLRGREWLREIEAGTAEKYLIDACARLQKSGLGPEAEIDDTITLDRDVFPGGGTVYDEGDGWFTRVNA